jgi:hypothetical protein
MGITHDALSKRVASLESYLGLHHITDEDGNVVHEPAVDDADVTVHEPETEGD